MDGSDFPSESVFRLRPFGRECLVADHCSFIKAEPFHEVFTVLEVGKISFSYLLAYRLPFLGIDVKRYADIRHPFCPPFKRETLPAGEEKKEKQRNEAEPKPRTFQTLFHKEPGSFSIAKNEGFSSEIDSSKAQFR